ncbi:MAG TPA: hypothetical protein VLZ28_02620 [Daejeonella sp.]|nr:hypothetical protein [Daejeonella sp.]
MARQIDSEITGTIDDIIFYERNGKFLMRSVQVQTAATRKAAKDYGRASNKAKILRQLLQPLLPNPKDRNMQNRLTPAMREFLALLPAKTAFPPTENPLVGFRFVVSSDLKDCLRFPLGYSQQPDGNILIELPAINPPQSIAAPTGTSRVQLKLMAVGFNLNDEQTFSSNMELISIPYVNEMQEAVNQLLEVDVQTTNLVVVAAALSYWNHDKQISQVGFMPVEIVSVFKRS